MDLYCSKCGAKNSSDNNFCPKCGSPIRNEANCDTQSSDWEYAIEEDYAVITKYIGYKKALLLLKLFRASLLGELIITHLKTVLILKTFLFQMVYMKYLGMLFINAKILFL